MNAPRKWQFLLILFVVALTIYNVLPTLFYYLQPLKAQVSAEKAERIAEKLEERLTHLEREAKDWVCAYCQLLHLKPQTISQENPQFVDVTFASSEEADQFRARLVRAGSLIPFAPARLSLASQERSDKRVLVQRKIPLSLKKEYFTYVPKSDRTLLLDRLEQIAFALAGQSESAVWLGYLQQGKTPLPLVETLASQINTIEKIFGANSPIAARCAAQFTRGFFANRSAAVQSLIASFDRTRDEMKREKGLLGLEEKGERLRILENQEAHLLNAETYVKSHVTQFAAGRDPWTRGQIREQLETAHRIDLSEQSPFFSALSIDWEREQIVLRIRPDVLFFVQEEKNGEACQRLLIDEISRIAEDSGEELIPGEGEVTIALSKAPNVSGYLVLDQAPLAKAYVEQIQSFLKTFWRPAHPDLQSLPIVDFETYQALPEEQRALCLVVASPLGLSDSAHWERLKTDSLYVFAKGIDRIVKTYEETPHSPWAEVFSSDFRALAEILHSRGFVGYAAINVPGMFAKEGDFLFEKRHFSQDLLEATRENFSLAGTKKYAFLELTDLEHRLLIDNDIETRMHEELVKWKDDYLAAQVSLDPHVRFDIPPPSKSLLWSNLTLSVRKYFRGDEKKIIRWGLDLSGGKTVQIALRDSKRQLVTNDADLKQGMNELHLRVNKMGVSEVSIRQVGHHIVLDFPGSQALSASELIKASTLYFHVVNEKFSPSNLPLAGSVNRFLQEVWNEAFVTKKTSSQEINAIAREHLSPEGKRLRSESASLLWEQGLRLGNEEEAIGSCVDDTLSAIALLRGDDRSEWHGQSHPLLIVMRNWALEGANLENIRTGYEPSKGNFLSFETRSSYLNHDGQKVQPKEALFAWTSRYSKEGVAGSSLENYSQGRGWRMAVILNDSVISAPTLDSPLKESAMISGSFSQREVSQLAADLKAGSLSFTPHILSEKNVSPELGAADRLKGITATIIALLLVVVSMILYYRFAGLIASVAVLFNLLILWATLQNLGAALTLAGLAGVILTVGMAVDANVLVFERVKEEFARSANIASALSAGYKRAYSAILDSNITTIIAALILLQFDAGPIKSFAVNLIIGIASSMFTALFMTRFYFTRWVQNPKHTALSMADWIRSTSVDFLKKAKLAVVCTMLIVAIGSALLFAKRSSVFGLDFTGGYAVEIELTPHTEIGYVQAAEGALLASGASLNDFQVRVLDSPHHLRFLLGTTFELPGKPFYQMQQDTDGKNPRIAWVVDALQRQGLALPSHVYASLESNWTAMSGQMSDGMRNSALLGLAIALLCIFIYLAFRFEYPFAAAALLCLFCDVFVAVAFIGWLFFLGVPIQIDLNTIAALMTIIGYSLNDKIIVFDRIREELYKGTGKSLRAVINTSLNATLSRTTITSGTTLLVLVALVLFGGASIFGFSLVMAIGVLFGTLSSWFIAPLLLLLFHKKASLGPLQ
ncbi:MAG: protein translocase subunit SecD [Chlamydiia bacterium]|nr:protein translocase subunit SecD [Chlamydiia bacterium]